MGNPQAVTRKVHTLDYWRRRLVAERSVIECSDIRLMGRDDEGVVLHGPGRIEASTKGGIRFFLYGTAPDGASAFRRLVAAGTSPYDAAEQLKLFATDFEGNEWAGGTTEVRPFTDHKHGWPMSGQLAGIATQASGPWVSSTSSVELLLVPPPSLPLSEAMTSLTSIGDDVVLATRRPGRQVVEALGSSIIFVNDASDNAMWITAQTSAELTHPYAERWLCEPLRVMLGTLIHPRLTARNFGDGRASVMLLPAQGEPRPTAFGLLQSSDIRDRHGAAFWQVYSDLLVMIGRARNPDGLGLMDGHHVTRLYEELSQAAHGSRWVMLLTLASTTEALAKSLMKPEDRVSDFATTELASMADHVRGWKGDAALRGRMLDHLGKVRDASVFSFLRKLARKGAIPDHCETWRRLRNSVAHGELVEPWSTQEGDTHLREMVALVHALTRLRILSANETSSE